MRPGGEGFRAVLNTTAPATVAPAPAAGASLLGAGPASAAHCADAGGPGNCDFAAHVRASNGPGAHNEGDHRGWSSCQETSANYAG